MAENIKLFNNGGLNLDDAIEFIAQNDILDAYNLRVKTGSLTDSYPDPSVPCNSPTARCIKCTRSRVGYIPGYPICRVQY
jgi:hypothetical protein